MGVHFFCLTFVGLVAILGCNSSFREEHKKRREQIMMTTGGKQMPVKGAQTKKIKDYISKTVSDLISERGYDTPVDFSRRSGVLVSPETVRKAVKSGEVGTWSLYLILSALGVRSGEIKKILTNAGDDVLAPNIGNGAQLNEADQAAINVFSRLRSQRKAYLHAISTIECIADLSGVDLEGPIKVLRREVEE
jgi:hypothetical protein